MRVLEITFIPPDLCSGGGMGIYQSIVSLAQNVQVDYIGPEFDKHIFDGCDNPVNVIFILKSTSCSIIRKIYRLIFKRITTAYYDDWKKACKAIKWDKYDAVHVETGRYSFVVRECHKYNKKVLIRMHNVEYDYGRNIFRISRKISDLFRWFSFAVNERNVVKEGDELIYLTDQDRKRTLNLYSLKQNHGMINPVCLFSDVSSVDNKKEQKVFRILLTGSMDYPPNINGVIWFLDNVFNEFSEKKVHQDLEVIIAGKKPDASIYKRVNRYDNVKLIDSPPDTSIYFKKASIYVAPVFDGAGMKVKVAEALSYGLPVVGTSHAFIGYEKVKTGLFLANSRDEFVTHINKLMKTGITSAKRREIFQEFYDNFSMESSCKKYRDLMRQI